MLFQIPESVCFSKNADDESYRGPSAGSERKKGFKSILELTTADLDLLLKHPAKKEGTLQVF